MKYRSVLRILTLAFITIAVLFSIHCSNNITNQNTYSLEISSPASDSWWYAGYTYHIQWQSDGSNNETVNLLLTNDSGSVVSIASTIPNNGEFTWQIPFSIPQNNTYRIIVKSTKQNNIADTSARFSILNFYDNYEPDNNAATATTISTSGTPQVHALYYSDADWYRFVAEAGKTYCIQTTGSTNTFLSLYDNTGLQCIQLNDDNGANTNAMILWTCTSSGNYLFKINGFSASTVGNYGVAVTCGTTLLACLTPVAASVYTGGNTLHIAWAHSPNSGSLVNISLYCNDTLSRSVIASTSNNGIYSWTIPYSLTSSSLYTIKIRDINDTSVATQTDRFSITNIPTTITFSSPNSLTQWNTGISYILKWASLGNTGDIATLSLYDSTAYIALIAPNVNIACGNVSWTVNRLLPTSAKYRIKFQCDNDSFLSFFSDQFTITYVPATLALTKPDSTSSWNTGTLDTISWICSGAVGSFADLALYDSTAFVANLTLGTSMNSKAFVWTIPWILQTSTQYRIKITATTDTTISSFSTPFTITKTPTTITQTAPDPGTVFTSGQSLYVRWSYTGDPSVTVAIDLFDSLGNRHILSSARVIDTKYYMWTVPFDLLTSGHYRIKIYCTNDTTVFSVSDTITIINLPSTVTITQPTASTSWFTGNSVYINWSYIGTPGQYVNLALYADSTTLINHITTGAATSGKSYYWIIPTGLSTSSNYRIKITSSSDSTVHNFSAPFTITKTPSTITMTQPAANANYFSGSTAVLSWTTTGYPGTYATIALYNDTTLVSTLSNTWTIATTPVSWTIAFGTPTSSNYRIKITSNADSSVFDYSDRFTITQIAATISVTFPTTGYIAMGGTDYMITWTSSNNIPGSYLNISLYDSTAFISTITTTASISTPKSYPWTPSATLPQSSRYHIKIQSSSDASIFALSDTFTINQPSPQIAIIQPVSTVSWNTGNYYTIYWSYQGNPGPDIFITLFDSTHLVQTIASTVSVSNGSYSWQIPSWLTTSKYRIKIGSTTMDSIFSWSNYFSINNMNLVDSYEPDSSSSLARNITVGASPQNHSLGSSDRDWLTFIAIAGTTYTLETQGSLDTYIDLFDSNGTTLLATNDDGGASLNAKIVWVCPVSGSYYFRVSGYSAGNYSVSVQ